MTGQMARRKFTTGFAMISVMLVILVFFIITVAISTTVVLQARINYETTMTEMSFYVTDAGLRYAIPRVMYRFFLRAAGIYSLAEEIYEADAPLAGNPDYKATMVLHFYSLDPVVPTLEMMYTHKNKVACLGSIYRTDDNSLVARRCIYADIFVGDALSAGVANIPGGRVRAKIKKYYEKNR